MVTSSKFSIDDVDKCILRACNIKPQNIQELSSVLGIDRKNVWQRLSKLEGYGFITKEQQGRYVYIHTTKGGLFFLKWIASKRSMSFMAFET